MNKKVITKLGIILGFLAVMFFSTVIVEPHTTFASGFTDAPTDISKPNADSSSPFTKLGAWIGGQLKYVYGLLVAIVSIIFIVKHEYSKLVAFLIIAIIVAIPIFAPNTLPAIAQSISETLTGK